MDLGVPGAFKDGRMGAPNLGRWLWGRRLRILDAFSWPHEYQWSLLVEGLEENGSLALKHRQLESLLLL